MGELEFILHGASSPVERLVAHHMCDGLAHCLHGNQLFVESDVTGDVLGLFISAVHGEAIELTNENIDGLSASCGEFRFLSLSRRLEVFKNTPTYRLEQHLNTLEAKLQSLEERMQQRGREIGGLQVELSGQLRVQELFEQRIQTEAESATRRANKVERNVAEVRSEVENVRETLREVRELAEGAQTKAASTEARLEAEVSALRTSTVGEIRSEIGNLRIALRELTNPSGWNSAVVPDFPKLFEDFKRKKFTLLWRGGRDGFAARAFHSRCNGHRNTLTVILDTGGNIFGGFTPVEWETRSEYLYTKADPSLKDFIFTLKNPHNAPARRFALKAEKKSEAICCYYIYGPHFCDIGVYDNCNANTMSLTACFGQNYTKDTGMDGRTFFTGSIYFKVKEIEVFEITD